MGPKNVPYPRALVVLAAVFVAATFLNAIHLSDNPLAENPMNVAGLALAGAFVLMRGLSARVWNGPARYAWLFFGVTAVLELGLYLLDRSGAGASSLRSYAQYVQALGVYFIFYDLARDRKAAATILRVFFVVGHPTFTRGQSGIDGGDGNNCPRARFEAKRGYQTTHRHTWIEHVRTVLDKVQPFAARGAEKLVANLHEQTTQLGKPA